MIRIKRTLLCLTMLFFVSGLSYAEAQNPFEGDWVADVAARVIPSVVNISSSKAITQQAPPLFNDPFFRDLFGGGVPREQIQKALGSGVIVSSDGFIVTNNHVVGGADKVEVRLSDGRVFPATIVGTDPKSDVAIIKINRTGLPAIKIGDSGKVRIGSFVLAVGNPFGLEQTVTMGIVSALGRSGLGITDYESFIQTDAAINPGNSGGALVNMKGELIGINTAIFSKTGGSVGIGFAIPTNVVMIIKKSIDKYGKVVRGWLGVTVEEVTPDNAKGVTRGAFVSDVLKASPAEKAGIRKGDVIIAIDGDRVQNTAAMRFQISEVMPGNTIKVKVLRDGKEKVLSVVAGDLSKAQIPEHQILVKDNKFLEGVSVADLTQAIRETLNIGKDIKGVVVIEVINNSAAARTGLRAGDVIVSLNNVPIASLQDFKTMLGSIKGNKISISIYRQGMVMTMTIIR